MDLTLLLIFGLATWRVSSLLVREAGPYDMFLKLREAIGIRHDENKDPYMLPDGFLPGLLSCVWCCSIWVAFFFYVAWRLSPFMAVGVASILAVSSVAILVDCHT